MFTDYCVVILQTENIHRSIILNTASRIYVPMHIVMNANDYIRYCNCFQLPIMKWSNYDVLSWLDSVGMEKFSPAFKGNPLIGYCPPPPPPPPPVIDVCLQILHVTINLIYPE